MFGEDRVAVLSALMDEIDFRDPRSNGYKDSQKILLLQEELVRCLKQSNFISIICQAIEGGERHKAMQQNIKIQDDLLTNICKITKMSSLQTVAIAFAACQSKYRVFVIEATRIYRTKLPDVTTVGANEVCEEVLHRLTHYITSNAELAQSELARPFLLAIRNYQQTQSQASFASTKRSNTNVVPPSQLDDLMTSKALRNRISLAQVLTEAGPACSANVELFKATLRETNIILDEDQIAEVLIMLVARFSNPTPNNEDDHNNWNLEAVAEVLAECCQGKNWTTVAQKLDRPNLSIRSEIVFQVLSRLFVRISGGPMPAAGLLGMWSNRITQLAMLILAANSPRNIVDFSTIVSADQQITADVPVPAPLNFSWLSLSLYQNLLQLASNGLALEVLEALNAAASMYPEYVTSCLAQVQDGSSGVRAEILRRTLPMFTGLTGSRPTSLAMMKKFLVVNPDLLVLLFRIAFKRSASVREIIEVDGNLKMMGPVIFRRVEEEGNVDEALGYWCVKADRFEATGFNLEEKLATVLESNHKHAVTFMQFAKAHAETLRPRSADGGLLSFECFAILLRAIQAFPNLVPIDEVRSLATALAQHQHGLQQQMAQAPAPPQKPDEINMNAAALPGRAAESDEVEEEANAYFQRIYTSDISIADVIIMLKRFKSSPEKREQEIFRCMIHNLFDEYRFFHKYPEKELQVTGKLFGALIQHQLVASITLGIALRYVLEALRKDPEGGGSNDKIFRFGKIALEQFRLRFGEWPQYCSHLVQIPHLAKHCTELYQDAQRAINNPVAGAGGASGVPEAGAEAAINQSTAQVETLTGQVKNLAISSQPVVQAQPNQAAASSATAATPAATVAAKPIPRRRGASSDVSIIDRMLAINLDVVTTVTPAETARDQIHFIINNIAKSNFDSKTAELKDLVTPEYYNWLANNLVVKRISTQPNLHKMYLAMLEALEYPNLMKTVLDSTYHNVTKLLQSPNITTSSSERSLLRNLGIWLGLMTLARNKPLLQRRIDLKELLFWGYETGRLIAVCSLVARILEGIVESKVFRPPNPWLMAVLGVMRELYEIEDLKINIKFEVQVLCKNINIRIEDIPKGSSLASCIAPGKEQKCNDFNVKSSQVSAANATPMSPQLVPFGSPKLTPAASIPQPPSQPLPAQLQQQQTTPQMVQPSQLPPRAMPSSLSIEDEEGTTKLSAEGTTIPAVASSGSLIGNASLEQTVIPNLASYISVNPTIQFFASNPTQRRLVALAVDRAIREIIQPVVERSVTIACVTTKQLVLKDYSSEPNEQHLRTGAHLMISNLAGSLALVTCKEPLRLSICNHLRSLLAQATTDQVVIEQIVQLCSNDNLDLGCMLIEKASMEKAIRDVDESMTSATQTRRKLRESGQPFVDAYLQKGIKYPRELPDFLRPKQHPQQLLLYESFQRARTAPPPSTSPPTLPQQGAGAQSASPQPVAAAPQGLTMPAAIEAYQAVFARIDNSLRQIQVQAQGRDVNMSMLNSEHEIILFMREIIAITQRCQVAVRNESAITFAENVFKRMLEGVTTPDVLRAEIMVGILEALREVSGGPKKLTGELVSWLNHYTTFNINDEISRKMHRIILVLLLRTKLLRSQDIDTYFHTYMDAGRNMLWVELALSFVRQCLADGLAATYEFANTFDTVSKMRPTSSAVKKNLQKLLTDLKSLASAKDDQKQAVAAAAAAAVSSAGTPVAGAVAGGGLATGNAGTPAAGVIGSGVTPVRDSAREHVTVLLEKWLRVWTSTTDQVFSQYLQIMHQYGVLKTEEAADRFFRISTELCVEACLKTAAPAGVVVTAGTGSQPSEQTQRVTLTFTVVDALSKLFLLLVRLADKESSDVTVRVNLLSRILNAIARTLLDDHEGKKSSKQSFDQRPYFRLLSNLAQDLGVPDAKQDPHPTVLPLLNTYNQVFMALQPAVVPGFAFAWLQLVSHRSFMPHLLVVKDRKGWPFFHRLLNTFFVFLRPYLQQAQLSETVRKLYKGALRVMLVLLHDFPEFLCDYHLPLCDVIPSTCLQLRNLVLSAFPRSMRLPDPFMPNLKVDLLPEISQPPRLLNEYFASLNERGIKARVDAFMTSRQPAELPAQLPAMLSMTAAGIVGALNVACLSALVVYVGTLGSVHLLNKIPLSTSPAMEIYRHLITALDAEGRYFVFNAMANQLRFPNSHTQFFSYVLLMLFGDAEDNEYLQEQITRVLLERLIVHRPHPWGLLITFIELIKNPRYSFWRKSFVHLAPEIERLFESVARSCVGSNAMASLQLLHHQQVPGGATAASGVANVTDRVI